MKFGIILILCILVISECRRKRPEDKKHCPKVKPIRNFDLSQMLGKWFVIQYYASSEEALPYRCMRAEFTMSPIFIDVTMNFTYSFTDDPINEQLFGNITWTIPDRVQPSHWTHSENILKEPPSKIRILENIVIFHSHDHIEKKSIQTSPVKELSTECVETMNVPSRSDIGSQNLAESEPPIDEGVYNTYVLDSDYSSWALLLHCAEKSKSPRYLSSFIMSREAVLGKNVISYLRDKLPRYDIDLSYMFDMAQNECDVPQSGINIPPSVMVNRMPPYLRRHPLKSHHG